GAVTGPAHPLEDLGPGARWTHHERRHDARAQQATPHGHVCPPHAPSLTRLAPGLLRRRPVAATSHLGRGIGAALSVGRRMASAFPMPTLMPSRLDLPPFHGAARAAPKENPSTTSSRRYGGAFDEPDRHLGPVLCPLS